MESVLVVLNTARGAVVERGAAVANYMQPVEPSKNIARGSWPVLYQTTLFVLKEKRTEQYQECIFFHKRNKIFIRTMKIKNHKINGVIGSKKYL